MRRRTGGRWLALAIVAASCSSGPGAQELAEDHAPSFAGTWYGTATYTYRQNGQVTSTSTADVQQQILVTGKNALQLPGFCGPTDTGLVGTVTSANTFTVAPKDCEVTSSGGCHLTVKVASGGGTLSSSSALQLAFHGSVVQQASAGCSAVTVDFDLTAPMTHTPPSNGLEIPQDLKVEKTDFYGTYNLTFTVTGSTQDIDVQAKIGAGSWQDVGTGYVSSATVSLGPDLPERTPVAFRVRNTLGNQSSDWSAEVSSDSGLRPPIVLTADGSSGTVRLSWQPRTDVTAMLIERSDLGVSTPTWTALASVSPPASSYVDDQAQETRNYSYRLRWVDGATQGFTATVYSVMVALRPPSGLTAVPGVESVQLTWQNQSTVATEVVISRAAGLNGQFATDLVHLPATATSYGDVGLATGLYTYVVQPRASGFGSAGASVGVATLPPAGAGTWETSVVHFPGTAPSYPYASEAALDDTDRMLAYSDSTGLAASDQPAWLPYLPANALPLAQPYFRLDSAFRPHLVYLRNTVQGTSTSAVVHDWFDGASWRSEELARMVASSYAFALDPAGRPVALVSMDGTGPGLRVVRWSGSAYVVEDPGVTIGGVTSSLQSMFVAVSPEGTVHVLAQDYSGPAAHASRSTAWSTEPAPLPTPESRLQRLVASTGDTLNVLTYDWTRSQLQLTSRDGSGWGTPVSLASNGALDPSGLRIGTSVTGGSPALVVSTAGGVQIARPADGWTEHVLTGAYGLLGIGYDGSNRLYVLVQGGYAFDGTTPVVVFRER